MEMFDRGVSLLSWAYNEEDSIAEFLLRAQILMEQTVKDYEIVLINDASIDNTLKIAKSCQAKNPRIKIFTNEINLNVGLSLRKAIEKASKEFLFWQTTDWAYDISNLREYLEYLKQYDIVQGARRKAVEVKLGPLKPILGLAKLLGIKHLTRRSDTLKKALVSVINYILIRVLFRVPLSDYQNVTFYPSRWVQSVEYEARSSFANPEGLIKAYWNGMSIKEVEINFIPRAKGIPKGTRIKAVFSSCYDILRLWSKWIVFRKRKFVKNGKISRLYASKF
jgi:glycosyltransferase involved in cell wall biosynthesis